MSDLALAWNVDLALADLVLEGFDLSTEEGLKTAVIISLFSDRRAEADDVLPTGVTDRRGWWGDSFADFDGDQIGSRLWLLLPSKRQSAQLERAVEFAQEALAWLVQDEVASTVSVTAEWMGDSGLALGVVIERPSAPSARFMFPWEATRGV